MGTTATYGLPYPEPEDLAYVGPSDFQGLAETTETAFLAPVISLRGTTDDADHSDGRLTWDTGSPLGIRGGWAFPSGNKRVIPPTTGYFLVTVQFPFAVSASIDPSVRFRLIIGTRVTGGATTTLVWATAIATAQAPTDPGPTMALSSVVTCDVALMGIEVVAEVVGGGSTISGNTSARLRIHQLSRLAP